MIDHLDQLLRRLLLARIPDLVAETHVRFQPPDHDWRAYVGNLDGLALNIYLVDVRENRGLHSNERIRTIKSGVVSETRAPRRLDCHYLVSAWSPASASAGQEPTLFEHGLLYQAGRVLLLADPLVPREVYDPDPLPPSFPEAIADAELPMTVVPAEGFPKFPEFWGTMGSASPWRPALYLRVTLPVLHEPVPSGPLVTTLLTDYVTSAQAGAAGLWAEIGGHLRHGDVPQVGVWVELEDTAGKRLRLVLTGAEGRFSLRRLRAGSYRLRAHPAGAPVVERDIVVPSETGEYDLTY